MVSYTCYSYYLLEFKVWTRQYLLLGRASCLWWNRNEPPPKMRRLCIPGLNIRRNGQWTDIRTDSKTLYSIIWTYEYDAIFWCYIHAIIGNRRIFTNFNSFQMFIENCQNLMLCMCQVFKMLGPFIFVWVRSSLGIASYKRNMMFVCLVVSKELANCWTYIVLLYNVASYRFWEGLWLYHHPAKRNTPYKK